MRAHDAVIVATGMITAVGLSAVETAASVRAGIAIPTATPWMAEGLQPFLMAQVDEQLLPAVADGTGDLSPRSLRLRRLAASAIVECCASLPYGMAPPLFLALPELNGRQAIDSEAFLQSLATDTGYAFDFGQSRSSFRGRAGGLIALHEALLELNRGTELAFVGGVDSYRDFWVLDHLDAAGRIKTERNLDSFLPGEGAGVVAVATPRAAHAMRLQHLARVPSTAHGFERGHLYSDEPYLGDGLATTIADLLASASGQSPIAEVYSSMNGESYWGREWGVAYLRNSPGFRVDHGMHHPAQSLGDTGAASGPLMLGLAALGQIKRYRQTPALVYASSDRGERAAAIVAAP